MKEIKGIKEIKEIKERIEMLNNFLDNERNGNKDK